ncbi:MAG TPA: hypothetical protein VFG76_03730, partial [Candidatus Polarisedimenticolia bacterium]|nr:hypothetical protein [Candidatus Polarisedimenticolia bacterium]
PFEEGLKTAVVVLPQPARAAGRPGLAIAIAHQGRGCDYLVMSWWGRQNELPTKVFVRDTGEWRTVRDDESFCVWDMEVLWFEREAYVATILAGGRGDASEAYLARRLTKAA